MRFWKLHTTNPGSGFSEGTGIQCLLKTIGNLNVGLFTESCEKTDQVQCDEKNLASRVFSEYYLY